MLDLQSTRSDADYKAESTRRLLAQGVQCGEHLLAFSFDWSRQIVDEFDVVPLPRAPSWVLGAASINGLIVPVIDIDSYFSASALPSQLQRGQRLLLGGVQAEDAENALAIVFSQTPVQLEYDAQPLVDVAGMPMRLQEVGKGIARDDQGRTFIEIDPQRLMDALAGELAMI